MAPSALLFDLGNVVVEIDFTRVFVAWASTAGCDPEDLGRRFCFDEAYEAHERGELDAAAYFAGLRNTLGVELSEDDLMLGWNSVYVGPVPGVTELLWRAADRFDVYAFTNTNPTHQAVWSVEYAEVLSPFKEIFCSCGLGLRKPDPDAFREVAARIGRRPEEVVFLDDLLENVEGARRAGMRAEHVPTFESLEHALIDLGV